MTHSDPRCPMCAMPLKTVSVQVPVYLEHQTAERATAGLPPEKILARYDTEEDVQDCPRCQGAY